MRPCEQCGTTVGVRAHDICGRPQYICDTCDRTCPECGTVQRARRRFRINIDWPRVGFAIFGALFCSAVSVTTIWAFAAILGIDPQWQPLTFGALMPAFGMWIYEKPKGSW